MPSPRRAAAVASLALACALPGAASAVRPGPAVLYAPPVDAPQLQNTGVWQAPPILVSGATAYRSGEFVYQDFLYDDLGAGNGYRYPADPRYAGNAADLVELRLKPLEGETAIRLTYNSMLDPALVATTIGLGGAPVALGMPHGANARMPAQLFVTVHGSEADATDALTGGVLAASLPVAVDLPRRQVEVRVPYAVFDPRGQRAVRVGAASGIWDPVAAAYAPQAAAAFFNVAFRFAEPAAVPGGGFRSSLQAAALSSGDLSDFAARIDFAKLAAGADDDSGVPATGFLNRIFASASEERQGRGDLYGRTRGCEDPCALQYSGRLQPYELYVPSTPPPPGGYPLTLDLHGCGNSHNVGYDSARQRQLGARGAGSIVLSPEGRGDCYWYYGQSGSDVFEAWADVARRYPLDPERSAAAGISMGGYGAFKLASAYPDLFAAVAAVVPCPSAGIQWVPHGVPPGGRASRLVGLVPSLRHVPVMTWQAVSDATCIYGGPGRAADVVERLDLLGYAFGAWTFAGPAHNQMASEALSQSQPLADFLGTAAVVPDPPRVTYAASVLTHEPAYGMEADHAYWLSAVRLRDAARRVGTIDVASAGFGRAAPVPPDSVVGSGVLEGGTLGPLPYASQTRAVAAPRRVPREDRLEVSATNVASATIDAERARIGCSPTVDVRSYALLKLRLAGCNTTYTVKRVCHATPVFDVVVRAPKGERARRLRVTFRGRPVPVRGRKVRLDARRHPDALTRVRVESVDRRGRVQVRATTHRWCGQA